MHWHWKAKVVILQKVPKPLPWCDHYGMHIHAGGAAIDAQEDVQMQEGDGDVPKV